MVIAGFDSTEELIWSKLSSMATSPLSTSANNSGVQITPTLLKERATASTNFDGASVTNITSNNLSLAAVYHELCKSLVRNIQDMVPASYLHQCGVREILCTGSIFRRHAVIYEAVKLLFDGMSVKLIDDVDAAYGATLMTS